MYYVLGNDKKPKLATYAQAIEYCGGGSLSAKLANYGIFSVWFSGIDMSGGASPLPLCFYVARHWSVVSKHWEIDEAVAAAEKLEAAHVSEKLALDAAAASGSLSKLAEVGEMIAVPIAAWPPWDHLQPEPAPPRPEERQVTDGDDPLSSSDGPRRFLL